LAPFDLFNKLILITLIFTFSSLIFNFLSILSFISFLKFNNSFAFSLAVNQFFSKKNISVFEYQKEIAHLETLSVEFLDD